MNCCFSYRYIQKYLDPIKALSMENSLYYLYDTYRSNRFSSCIQLLFLVQFSLAIIINIMTFLVASSKRSIQVQFIIYITKDKVVQNLKKVSWDHNLLIRSTSTNFSLFLKLVELVIFKMI